MCLVSMLTVGFSQAQDSALLIDQTDRLRPIISVKLPAPELDAAERQEDYSGLLALFLVTEKGLSSIPVTGYYERKLNELTFQPVTDLGSGLSFSIRYSSGQGQHAYTPYTTPKTQYVDEDLPRALNIYPGSEVLPENILCFHVLFDRPMNKDTKAYQHARIYSNGEEVPLVWKHRAYWTHNGSLLVLMVHPGRIKRGIDYFGKAFEVGKEYTLVIEAGIKDAQDRKLNEAIKKTFTIEKADRKVPKIRKSQLLFPDQQGATPIQLSFSEPMDFGCMVEGIQVLDSNNHPVPIKVVHRSDDHYHITPIENWQSGTYQLTLKPTVGDLCGNRFNKKFETRRKPSQKQIRSPQVFAFTVQ